MPTHQFISQEEDIKNQIEIHRGIIKARWLLIFGLAALGFLLKITGHGESTLHPTYGQILLLVALASAYNLTYLLYLKRDLKCTLSGLRRLSFFQVTVDIIVFTAVVYLAGGIDASAFLYYMYPIIVASALYRTRGILYAVFLTTSLYALVIGLEFYQVIPHFPAYSKELEINHYLNYAFTFAIFVNVIVSLALAGGFSSVISKILEDQTTIVKNERDRISAIIESLADGIILIDNHHRIILVNKNATQLLQLPKAKLLNLKIDRQTLEDIKELKHIFKIFFPSIHYRSPSLKQQYEITLEHATPTILNITTVAVTDQNNRIIGFLKSMQNITREKAIDRMKSEFISIAAHQLRTPLSAIKWSLKMILDGDLGPTNEELTQFIQKGYRTNERMIRLVNDLLNVSRIEEGRFRYKFTTVNPVHFLNSIVQEISPTAKSNKVIINWKPPKGLFPKIYADSDRLRLALQNILDNSLRYSVPAKSFITITLSRADNDFVKIAIEDNGIGIPEDEQRRIFSKFYRGSNVIKMQTEGSGLGLFIVKNIIEKHKGHIEFTSKLNKGTTFTVYLPIIFSSSLQKQPEKTFKRFLTDF